MISTEDLLFFIFIGCVVSLDVAALTCVKKETYINGASWNIRWAFKNAFWHAALLAAYSLLSMLVFDIALPFSIDGLIAIFRDILKIEIIGVIFIEIKNHMPFIIGFIVIAMVWRTYLEKICDNPLEGNTESVQQFKLPTMLLRKFFSSDFVKEQAQAMMVAADMLALAFLLKSLQKLGPLHEPLKLAVICAIIFACVFSVCVIVSTYCNLKFRNLVSAASSDGAIRANLNALILFLKLLEPFLIFYFLMGLMSFVVWGRLESSYLFFIGSAGLVVALIQRVKMERILLAVGAMTETLLNAQERKQ